jgi:hypothetical protein
VTNDSFCKSPHRASAGWAFLALIVLLGINSYSLVSKNQVASPPLPHGDGPDYESLAYSLSVGDGFEFAWEDPKWQAPYRESPRALEYSQLGRRDWPGPTASRPPALPWLISMIYRMVPRGPHAFAAVRWMSVVALSIAGGLAVWLTGILVHKSICRSVAPTPVDSILHGFACALAMALASIDRTIKTYMQDFLTEPWALLGVTCLSISLVRWSDSQRSFRWILAVGVSIGWMILFRSLFIVWFPLIVLGLAIVSRCLNPSNPMERSAFRWFATPGWIVLVVCLIAGPWWVRNCWVTGHLMPMGGQGSASLRGGYSDEALRDWGNWHSEAEISMHLRLDAVEGSGNWTAAEREVALAALANQETWTWIKDHWGDLPRLGAMRLMTHWGPWRVDHIAWKSMALVGLFWIYRSAWQPGILLASVLLADALTTICLYETGGRFLIPLHGVLYALAGVGLAGCLALLRGNPVHPMHEETEHEESG